MWYLCSEIFKTTPDDPRITEMDPITKLWMFENWQADKTDLNEIAKNHAYLLASFSHPEQVRKLVGADTKTHESNEEDVQESMNIIKNFGKSDKPKRKRQLIKR